MPLPRNFEEKVVFKLYQILRTERKSRIYVHDKENYFETAVKSAEEGNLELSRLIQSEKPFFACLMGMVEMDCIMNYLSIGKQNKRNKISRYYHFLINNELYFWHDTTRLSVTRNAGFFPNTDEKMSKFAQMHLDNAHNIDFLAAYGFWGEDFFYHKYCKSAYVANFKSFEPFFFKTPWTLALKGKNVLVIHPFDRSIHKNYTIREKLFSELVLPEFELKTIRAVQSSAYNPVNFTDWFSALDSMIAQMHKTNFDIALIGAGAYGYFLANEAKKMGKQAVLMRGPLQLLFGIKGKRYDEEPDVSALFNSYWTRPLPEEQPGNYLEVENGAYW